MARAIVASGMMLAGTLLVASWLPSTVHARDWPAIVGVVLIAVGFFVGVAEVVGSSRGERGSGFLDRLDDRLVDRPTTSEPRR